MRLDVWPYSLFRIKLDKLLVHAARFRIAKATIFIEIGGECPVLHFALAAK